MFYSLFKRLFDVSVALAFIILLSPVIFCVSLAIALFLGRPILFVQKRPGLAGEPFYVYKFRSMTDERDVNGQLLPDTRRLTRFGRFLRKTSLDELPQLVNVLRGDMSLVGPRPLLMEYLPLYTEQQRRRQNVRPGITGWAQVNGRNAIGWEDKFNLDVWYVDNRSFCLDLKILYMTLKKVLNSDGISAKGEATMPKFTGTKDQQNKMSRVIAVYGASGFGREVMPLCRGQFSDPNCQHIFIDDGDVGEKVNGHRVLRFEQFLEEPAYEKSVIIAIADPTIRAKLTARCQESEISVVTVVADNVVVMDEVEIGEGAILAPFVTLTSNISIGKGFQANIYSYVAHDCVIGDFVTFAPAVRCNGNIEIRDGAYIGTGAIIKQGRPGKPLIIGENAVVGMGAVVTKDVPAGTVVIGNPARPLVRN